MNKTKRVAICQNLKMWDHEASNTAVAECIAYCNNNNIEYIIVDPYANDAIENLLGCDAAIWFMQNYLYADLLQAGNILHAVEQQGVKVFPSNNTIWHFDDKIAEMYAFKAVGAPIPQSWVFYSKESVKEFASTANYPVVAKLRNGSGASNVKLIKSKSQLLGYASQMFGKGYDPSPSLMYKAYSKAQSSRDFKTMVSRIKKIPMFLKTRMNAKMMPNERGYCYLQGFVDNDGYDIKVAVIGDKLSYFVRNVRKGDFRASGGGDFFYARERITKNIIDSAFETAKKLKLQCVGFDYVVDRNSGQGMIIEMCYGFDFEAVAAAGGYFDPQGKWHDEPLIITTEIMKMITA